MSNTYTFNNEVCPRKISRLAKHLNMAKLIDTNARMEEARENLYKCQMQHTDVDYRESNTFTAELTTIKHNLIHVANHK